MDAQPQEKPVISAEESALQKVFIKSVVENIRTPPSVYASLSPYNLLRVVQDAANNGERKSRRHNPALSKYLIEAMEKEDFPANVLGVLLAKKPQGDYFKKLQDAALAHITRFPGKAEAAVVECAKRRPDKFEHDAEGYKAKRKTVEKSQLEYGFVDIKLFGESVASPEIPMAKRLQARNLAYVQFWNDYAAGRLEQAGSAFRPVANPVPFRHKIPLKLNSVTPTFNDEARFDLPALAAEKGYTLNYEQTPDVEVLGQNGVTATFTLAGRYSKNKPFEFTVTRFGENVETADNVAAMTILARYHNCSPEPKQ